MKSDLAIIVYLTIISAAVALGAWFGIGCSSADWRAEAVEKGHAEYVLKGRHAVWQWKETK